MLTKIPKKSVLLLGVVMALCAFVLPSMAPAASWSPVGTSDGVIDSSSFGFSSATLNTGAFCRNSNFRVTVDSAAIATITATTFANCHGLAGLSSQGCTATFVGTRFPWRATAISTSNIQIHGVHIDVRLETTPPAGSVACTSNGIDMTLTGTLSGVTYSPSTKTVTFGALTGPTLHILGVAGGFVAPMQGLGTATGLLNILD